jgi:hypothetical protein
MRSKKPTIFSLVSFGIFISLATLSVRQSLAEVETAQPAPDFTLTDSTGKSHKLSGFKGKTVVLEWVNFECPFVRKHYDSKNMQALQEAAQKDGVIWLSILSSKKGKQGYLEAAPLDERRKKEGSNASAILMDADGKVGTLYGAKTTPHLYIVNESGILVYQGAIDNTPSTDVEDVKGAKNYVTAALADLKAKRPVATPTTKPYGCGVKY